jgi:predicted short-subunit dehydrogenase-like oxidoreductase (DUF2520 family)
MLSRSMSRTVSIIGAGRVGKTIGKRLRQLGWRVGAVVTRSASTARAAVRVIGGGTPHANLTRDALDAGLILLATPDRAIAPVARSLAGLSGGRLRGRIVLHTSGALDSSVLGPLERRGAATGSLHPMQTFSGRTATKLDGIVFAVEGNPRAKAVAERIARALGGVPVPVQGKSKAAYHAAGAFAAGHVLALIEAGTQMLVKLGFPRHQAAQALLPLARQTLDNFERWGPRASWTGPIARGDFAVVRKHTGSLRLYPREFRESYAALALLAGRVLARNPAPTIKQIKRSLRSDRRGNR